MQEEVLNQYFEKIVVPQIIYEKSHARKGGFNIHSEDGDYLKIVYTWEKGGVYERVTLPARA